MKSFDERFNCKVELSSFEEFKDKTTTLIFEQLGEDIQDSILEMDFLKQLGKGAENFKITLKEGWDLSLDFTEKTLYSKNTLIGKNLMESNDKYEYILKIEKFLNLESLKETKKNKIISGIDKIIKSTKYPIKIMQNKKEIIFVPSNCTDLDTQVDKAWHWLDKYPTIKKDYAFALKNLTANPKESIDHMRTSLENLIKKITNKSSTVKLKVTLFEYLRNKNISSEIINTFTTIFSHLEDFQNKYVKHTDPKLPEHIFNEIETNFLLYQYSNFINLVASLDS